MSIRYLKYITYLLALLSPFNIFCQDVEWMTWEEAMTAIEKSPRKVLVNVHTEWCSWCKKMDKNTFQDPDIASYINENFYNVYFDAQVKHDIVYQGKVYKFVKTSRGGYHELAKELLQGRLSFPTTVFIDEEAILIQPIKGYQKPETFEQIIHYFNEDQYKITPWKRYSQLFQLNKNQNKVVQPIIPVKNNE